MSKPKSTGRLADRATDKGWAGKVLALIRGGNATGAISQIKACASLKDVQQLRKLLDAAPTVASLVESAVTDQLHELSHPRLHRSP